MKNLQEYLHENFKKGIIDHVIRSNVDILGRVSFYIHPLGFDGDTLDFYVQGNDLKQFNVEGK